jgi:hypothetical protein
MTMTQRYAGMLRRHAGDWEKQAMPVQAECARQAARHMEELQAKVDAIASPWQPMKTAPKDGLGVLVLLDGCDMPHSARWLRGLDDPHATEQTTGPGWHLTWDGWPVPEHDGPRYWMHCPSDPDA